jgi:hypothetical protein
VRIRTHGHTCACKNTQTHTHREGGAGGAGGGEARHAQADLWGKPLELRSKEELELRSKTDSSHMSSNKRPIVGEEQMRYRGKRDLFRSKRDLSSSPEERLTRLLAALDAWDVCDFFMELCSMLCPSVCVCERERECVCLCVYIYTYIHRYISLYTRFGCRGSADPWSRFWRASSRSRCCFVS